MVLTPRLGLQKSRLDTTLLERDANEAANVDYLDSYVVVFLNGALIDRPSPGVPGRIFFATDQGRLFWDSGSQWFELRAIEMFEGGWWL
ncbi:MAG: hypothetical protein N3G75_06310 [Methanothrix sp.]|nr:hypothetical protein [Methanothrix sp.]MCX8207428.1 hypothetical protein [Methanothrix sp.]